MLCMRDVLMRPLEGESVWYDLKPGWLLSQFSLMLILMAPFYPPIGQALLLVSICVLTCTVKGKEPRASLCGDGNDKEHTLANLVAKRYSSLSTTLTVNKGILHTLQISRVTFCCTVGKELLLSTSP